MTTRQLRWEDVVQTFASDNVSDIEHLLDDKRDLWPGFSTKLVLSWLWDDYCEGGACDTHCVVRTGDGRGDSDESDKEDVYQVSWEAGFRSWWQNLLPRRSSEGKQRRNFVGELGGATCRHIYNFLLVDASQSVSCQCACSVERLPRLFFLFPWLPRMGRGPSEQNSG